MKRAKRKKIEKKYVYLYITSKNHHHHHHLYSILVRYYFSSFIVLVIQFFFLFLSLPCFSPLFWRLTQFLLCLDYELLCGCVFGVGVACVNFIENNKNATQFTQPKPICRSNARTVFEWKLCTSRMCETRKQKLWKKLGSKSKGRRQEKWKHTLARKP